MGLTWMTRGPALVLVAALVLVPAALGIRHVGGDGAEPRARATVGEGSSTPSPQPTPTRLPTAVPNTSPKLDAKQRTASAEAEDQLLAFFSKSAGALEADTGKVDLASLAAGPALSEIQAMAVEYHKEDKTISGAPKALGSEVVSADLSSRPQSVTLAVCLDNAPVVIRDAKGRNLSKNRSPSELKVLNLYQLQRLQDDWLVVGHSIPADSSCKNLKAAS